MIGATRPLGRAAVLAVLLACPSLAIAQVSSPFGDDETLPAAPQTSDQVAAQATTEVPSIQSSLGPYGDPGGYRAFLQTRGITYSLTYIGEGLGNFAGGERRGAIGMGRLDTQLDVDLEKLAGLKGSTFRGNFYQIHGHGLSRYYLGNLSVVSGIEALSSTRLYELWLGQTLLDGKLAIRAGQLAADTEFLVSQYAGLFVNSTFGWPAITGANLPSGGPAYPLATPAVRLRYAPDDQLVVLLGLYNGDPAGSGPGDPQRNNRGGVEFRGRDPALMIGEAAYSYTFGEGDSALPGTAKFGGWYHAGIFASASLAEPAPGATSLRLADPTSSGIAKRFRGDSGLYAVLDQLVFREEAAPDNGLGVFLRASISPGDRNPVALYLDGGLTYKGLFPGRKNDTLGLALSYARIGEDARRSDRDLAFFNPGNFSPIRSSEALIEVTYQAEVVPGFTIQPDLQYIFRPGGNVVNPLSPVGAVEKNAVVAGLRATIRY